MQLASSLSVVLLAFALPVGVAEDVKLAPSPAIAAAFAATDIATVGALDREFQRYVWVPLGNADLKRAANLVMNEVVSEVGNPLIVVPADVGQGTLLRYDLRQLAPRTIAGKPDVLRLISTWEKLADGEPFFHAGPKVVSRTERIKIQTTPYEATETINGKVVKRMFDWKWGTKEVSTNVFPLAPAVGQELTALATATNSQCPIVHIGWFLKQTTSTVDGGLYYDFLDMERAPRGRTAQAAFLSRFGADEQLVATLRSDQKAGVFRSRVTGKPRVVKVFGGAGGRPDINQGLITLTEDMSDADRDAKQHPIRNLVNFKFAAVEVIAERINGLHAYVLFDGAGALQNEAPPNVVTDRTVPAPHTTRLQPAISCYRCHNTDEKSVGYQSFDNDVRTMLQKQLDVFGEKTDGGPVTDTVSRIAGLYSGVLDKPIRRSRDDFSDAVLVATRGLPVSKAYQSVVDEYNRYVYELVTPVVACRELGYEVAEAKATAVLQRLVPPLPPDDLGISPEDPVIGALKTGLSVNRLEWEQVYADAYFRATKAVADLQGAKK